MRDVSKEILSQIQSNDIVLYMKGSASMPMCGFSSTVVQILNNLSVNFMDIDILQDLEIREGIKKFSNWPTIPQLYIKGEFIGGCDITKQMYENGQLLAVLIEKGILKN